MPMTQEPRQRDIEHVRDGEGVAVSDGLHSGEGPSSLKEHVCLGPQAQLVSLLDPWVRPQRHPEGT